MKLCRENGCWCCCRYFAWYWPGGPTIVNLGTNEDPLEILGESAYVHFFIGNVWSFVGAFAIVAFQAYLLFVLLRDVMNVDQDQVPEGADKRLALASAMLLLALRILPHLGQGLELLWKGCKGFCRCFQKWLGHDNSGEESLPYETSLWSSITLIWVGIVEIGIGGVTVAIGVLTALNVVATLTSIITRVTVATFIEGVDETAYAFLKYWSKPEWYNESQKRLKNHFEGEPPPSLDADEILALKELLLRNANAP